MRAAPIAFTCLVLLSLPACETTGDPQQGGLFGWSEAKARDRQQEKREELARSEVELERERGRSADLRRQSARERQRTVEAQEARRKSRDESLARLSAAHQKTRGKLSALRASSVSAATDSKARVWATEIEEIAGNEAMSPNARVRELRRIDAEIDSLSL